MIGLITLYLVSLLVLLIVILIHQLSLSRKVDEEMSELRGQLNKLIRVQGETESREQKSPEASAEERVEKEPWSEMPSLSFTVVSEEEEETLEKETAVEEVPAETPVAAATVEEVAETIPAMKEEPVIVSSPVSETAQEKLRAEEIPQPVKIKKAVNYEKLIGENLFGKIGILVLVVGVGFFVKYAIDKDWINEVMRTVLGFLIGSALLFVAERLREKYRTFSSLLAGGAFGVFYLTVSIAYHYYHLFTQEVAFIILVLITILMSVLAILYDRRELAIIALVGGFLAPFIVSSGDGNYVVLFTYIAVLNLGMFFVSMYKKWAEIPVVSFVFTYIILGLYVMNIYLFTPMAVTTVKAGHLLAFATLFYFIFLLPVMLILRNQGLKMNRLLLSLVVANNFLYLGLGCLFLADIALPFRVEGLLSLFIAIINLGMGVWLKKTEGDYRFLLYTMIGLVLTFVSIAVPLQLDGHYITLFWASEMVLLLWLYARSQIRVYEYGTCVLMALTAVSFVMDWQFEKDTFVVNLYTALAAGAFAWLQFKYREELSEVRLLTYRPWNGVMWCVAAGIFYLTFMKEINSWDVFYTDCLQLLFTVGCIGVFSFAFHKRFDIGKFPVPYLVGIGISALSLMTGVMRDYTGAMVVLISWISVAVIIGTLYYVGRMYYARFGFKANFTIYLNVLATLLWLSVINQFLYQIGVRDEASTAFSVGLTTAGFVQMLLGMRLHQKVLRMISLVVFGIVLVKLVLIDLWVLPPLGKIIVFILLGVLLLVLSFLYQKLKNVLFKDDDEID